MRLDDTLKHAIARRLAGFETRRVDRAAHPVAAVAITLVEEGFGAVVPGLAVPGAWSGEAALVLTRRAVTLARHAGQWALPGGRVDPGEDIGQAALRELREEVGLSLDESSILGTLDDYVTRSGFVMVPVVVWAGAIGASLAPQEAEVESIHRIRVREFMRDDAPLLEPGDDAARPILRMPVGSAWIAAPTAAVIYQFREVCIAGRGTRVAHFDQPLFARR